MVEAGHYPAVAGTVCADEMGIGATETQAAATGNTDGVKGEPRVLIKRGIITIEISG